MDKIVDKIDKVLDTIALKTFWGMLAIAKQTDYGQSISITETFKARPVDLYHCLQKELREQSRIGVN